MGDILFYEDHFPHIVHEAMCVKCLHRWIDVRPQKSRLKDLECPNCHEKGYVINTGEDMEE